MINKILKERLVINNKVRAIATEKNLHLNPDSVEHRTNDKTITMCNSAIAEIAIIQNMLSVKKFLER
jgi:hypothetical protein